MPPHGSRFDNPAFVAQGGFSRMQEVGRALRRFGIESEVVAPPKGTNLNA